MPAAIPFIVAAGYAYAATTAVGVVAGLYATAAVVTAVGAATKNEKMQLLGGVIGMGAGDAGAASAANAASAADAVRTADSVYAGTSAADVATAADTASAAGEAAAAGVAGEAAQASPVTAETAETSPAGAERTPSGIIERNMVAGLDTSAAAGAQPPADAARAMTRGSGLEQGLASPTSAAGPFTGASGWGQDTLSAQGLPNDTNVANAAAPRSFEEWLKENAATAKVGGGIIQGAMDYYGKQQLADDGVRRQKEYQDWVRQRYSESVRNLQVPGIALRQPSSAARPAPTPLGAPRG
jgi:hypothetical protein